MGDCDSRSMCKCRRAVLFSNNGVITQEETWKKAGRQDLRRISVTAFGTRSAQRLRALGERDRRSVLGSGSSDLRARSGGGLECWGCRRKQPGEPLQSGNKIAESLLPPHPVRQARGAAIPS